MAGEPGDPRGSQGPCLAVLGCSGDLVSRLSNGPCDGACYFVLFGRVGDTDSTYEGS